MSSSKPLGSFSTKWFVVGAVATFLAGIVKVVVIDRFGRPDRDES